MISCDVEKLSDVKEDMIEKASDTTHHFPWVVLNGIEDPGLVVVVGVLVHW